ncbi:hypothetical protein RJ639_034527 [Escallonia herrerae]|uniref:Uncharacterized protein n=1 Tax=Escallonia herrerae TaxID=1293975 RepID=A0AA88WT57_9ASTE|nr:hypothetical protein RJ639_034527 [Escallonia herrerae]
MSCKKHHSTDLSSSVGVCASCFREHLFYLRPPSPQPSTTAANPAPPLIPHRYSTTTTSPLLFIIEVIHIQIGQNGFESYPNFTDHRDSCTASTSSPSWLSNLLAGHRKKQLRLFSLDESAIHWWPEHMPKQGPRNVLGEIL